MMKKRMPEDGAVQRGHEGVDKAEVRIGRARQQRLSQCSMYRGEGASSSYLCIQSCPRIIIGSNVVEGHTSADLCGA